MVKTNRIIKKEKLYWPPAVTVDAVIFTIEDNKLKVLLIKRGSPPFLGQRALPGGFLFKNESTLAAAKRILERKAGIKNIYLEQLYTFDGQTRDSRGHILTVAYFALIDRSKIKFVENKNTQTPSFHEVRNLSKLAFDHRNIINYALKRIRYKLEYTNMIFSLLPKYFILSQLQKSYEIILDKKLDKRNFRKKFLALKLIKPTGKILKGTRQRPARLYRFIFNKPVELKKFF